MHADYDIVARTRLASRPGGITHVYLWWVRSSSLKVNGMLAPSQPETDVQHVTSGIQTCSDVLTATSKHFCIVIDSVVARHSAVVDITAAAAAVMLRTSLRHYLAA